MSTDGASYPRVCVRREGTDWGGRSRCLCLVWGAIGAPWVQRQMHGIGCKRGHLSTGEGSVTRFSVNLGHSVRI